MKWSDFPEMREHALVIRIGSSVKLLVALACVSFVAGRWSVADERMGGDSLSSAESRFFETKIRPVLVERCYDCHAGENAEGNLRVDSRAAIRKGGDRGPAILPKKALDSLLLAAITLSDPDLRMPPKGPQLSKSVIADFRKWIEMGAPDPRSEAAVAPNNAWKAFAAAKDHWAYQPPPSELEVQPVDSAWPLGDVDNLVWQSLAANQLAPSRDADPRTLLRRLHFDLVGLPPSPADIKQFLAAIESYGTDAALAAEVDGLLQMPQFGERWGRHWLDVARFGESSGGESNVSFPYAWRYRDYVIDAMNTDLPYDRFLMEQIAGDLLPFDNDAQRARLLTATGFLAVGTKNLGENNDAKFQADLVDEQIDSLTRAVMGSSVACARCHDHKFDPFSMNDYYALAGIFASTKTFFGTFTSPANNRGGHPLVLPRVEGQKIFHASLSPENFEKLKARQVALAAVRAEIQEARRAAFSGEEPKKRFTLREVLANVWQLGPVEGKLETIDDQGIALPLAMGALDATVVDVPLLVRGEIGREGAIVPRAFPTAIPVTNVSSIPESQSGRLELAQWLTSPDHPLTARVYVNRIWKHLFGQGLVTSVDNFGTRGELPSHPELLDMLAVDFVEEGWSTKRLIRMLVLSRTYRQASDFDPNAFKVDPANSLLWRMSKRRLEAEAIRDAMLQVSGELKNERPGGSHVARIIGDRPISLIGLNKKLPKDLDGSNHRSVYLPVIRDRLPDVLSLFDFAEPSLVTGNRETTNVPTQGLYLMNSSFVQNHARSLAKRLTLATNSPEQFIDQAFQLCFGRSPQDEEAERALAFLKKEDDLTVFSFCQAVLCAAEFRNLD